MFSTIKWVLLVPAFLTAFAIAADPQQAPGEYAVVVLAAMAKAEESGS